MTLDNQCLTAELQAQLSEARLARTRSGSGRRRAPAVERNLHDELGSGC